MPHPLPDDVFSVNGLRYYLVALPDDSAFSRAALAIYSELENAYKWGLEGQENPDSEEAAQLWSAAVAETVRLIQMGWPDDVLNAIDEIESILSALQRITGCCPDEDISDGDLFTDVVEEGVGDVPPNIVSAGYASSSSDWAGFATYKCMIAHVVVDDLAGKLRKLAPLVDDAGIVIGGIGVLAAIVASLLTGGGFAIAIAILGGLGAVAALYAALSDGSILTDIADAVDANHDELACAFVLGDGAESSVAFMYAEIDTLFSAADAIILKNLNSGPVAKALYSGRYDQQNIAQRLADNGYVASSYNCDCEEEDVYTLTYDFNDGLQGWGVNNGMAHYQEGVGDGKLRYNVAGGGSTRTATLTRDEILSQLELAGTVDFLELSATFTNGDNFIVASNDISIQANPSGTPLTTPGTLEGNFDSEFLELVGDVLMHDSGVRLNGASANNSGQTAYVYIDNVTVKVRVTA